MLVPKIYFEKHLGAKPLRSRIFPWVISPVGRYLMHFYRFIYSFLHLREPFLPCPSCSNNPPPARPVLLVSFFVPLSPFPSSSPRFHRPPCTFFVPQPSVAPLQPIPLVYFYSFPPPVSTFHSVLSSSPLKQNERRARLVSIKEWINVDWKGIKKACTHIHIHIHIHIYVYIHIKYIYVYMYMYTHKICIHAHI